MRWALKVQPYIGHRESKKHAVMLGCLCKPLFGRGGCDLLTRRVGGGGGKVCGENICYHVTAFVILFSLFVCLFDLILYVHSTIFHLCGMVLPGLNQY